MFLTFSNKISQTPYSFETKDEFASWIRDEMTFYTAIFQQARTSSSIGSNRTILQNIQTMLKSDQPIDQFIDQLEKDYIPYKGYLDQLLGPKDNEQFKAQVVEAISDYSNQQIPLQGTQLSSPLSIILARILVSYGSPKKLINDTNELLERGYSELENTKALLKLIADEWDEKKIVIEGMAAQARMRAPTDFWVARSDEKNGVLGNLRLKWNVSLILISILIILFGALSWNVRISETMDIYYVVQRLVVFGSLASIIVWWSRQALKDIRVTEHLYEDAKERVAMIQTFAALKGEELGGDGYQTILNAIFRSASTPSHDDAGPKLPVEILIKSLIEKSTTGQ